MADLQRAGKDSADRRPQFSLSQTEAFRKVAHVHTMQHPDRLYKGARGDQPSALAQAP
jgi:hypothetical protein